MRTRILLITFSVIFFNSFSQQIPSQATVMKDAQSYSALRAISQTVGEKLTWDQIQLQYNMFANGDEIHTPVFYTDLTYEGELLGLQFDNVGYFSIIATTPKDGEGVYYDISIQITYTRASENEPWIFRESTMANSEDFYRRGTEKIDQKAVSKVMETLKKFQGDEAKNGGIDFQLLRENDYYDLINIESIIKDANQRDELYTNQRMYHFIVRGTVVVSNDQTLAELKAYYTDAAIELEVYEERNDQGNWQLKRVKMDPNFTVGTKVDISEEEQKSILRYKTLRIHGFNAVYQQKSTFERSLFNQADMQQNTETIRLLFETFKHDQTKGKQMIEQLVLPTLPTREEIIRSYCDFFQQALAYQCEIEITKETSMPNSNLAFSEAQKSYTYYSGLKINRERCSGNKTLTTTYKSAGMTKTQLKSGGELRERAEDITIEFYNGKWYITSPLRFKNNQSWN